MSNASVSIQFSAKETVTDDDYWIKIEQDESPVTVTKKELATMLDSFFGVEPCNGTGDGDVTIPDEDKFIEAVQTNFDLNLCDSTDTGQWKGVFQVYLNDPDADYVLRYTNGKTLSTSVKKKKITGSIVVQNQSSTTLDYHVLEDRSVSFWWNATPADGSTPEITRVGRVLSWDSNETGTICYQYWTQYDEVSFLVYAEDDGEYGECDVAGFYQGLYAAINLQQSTQEDDTSYLKDLYCPTDWSVSFADNNAGESPTVECFVDVQTVYKCQCSGDIAYTIYSERIVTCPDGQQCKTTEESCRINKGTVEEFGGYVDCNETTGDMSDPEFYKQNCCFYPDGVTLPKCKSVYSLKAADKGLSTEKKAELTKKYNGRVKFVPVYPIGGNCGTLKTTQLLQPLNCCDEVEEDLKFTEDDIPAVLPAGSWCMLTAQYGADWRPYTWTTSNHDTRFLNGERTIESDEPVRLVADDDFCGYTIITVTDGCTTQEVAILSPDGDWEEIEWDYEFARNWFEGVDYDEPLTHIASGYWGITAIRGQYKLYEAVYMQSWSASSKITYPYTDESDIGSCPQDSSWLTNINNGLDRAFDTLYRLKNENEFNDDPIIVGNADWYEDHLDSGEPENPANPGCLSKLRSVYRSSVGEAVSFSSEYYYADYRFSPYPWVEDVTFYSVFAHILVHDENRDTGYTGRKSHLYKWVCK